MPSELLRPGERQIIKVGKLKAGKYEYPRVVISLQLQNLGVKPGDEVYLEVGDDKIIITKKV